MGEAFTRNFKALREDKGLRQYEFAKACGLRQGTVSMWETQNTQPRFPKVIQLLCNFFQCTESDLFGYSDGYYAKTRGGSSPTIKPSKTTSLTLVDGTDVLIPDYVVDQAPDGMVLYILDTALLHVIPTGAVVYVDTSSMPSTGDIAALRLDGEIVCRRITVHDEVYVLESDTCDSRYKRQFIDRSFPPKGFEILGKVVWIQREL